MRHYFYLLLAALLLSGCAVKYKSLPYFTDLPLDSVVQEQIQNQTVLKIQKNDILALTVSSLNQEASAIFNMGSTSSMQNSANGSNNPVNTANGFLVDNAGAIQLPLVGSVKVEGLTTSEARNVLEKKLTTYLKEPVVSMRLVNFRVSVLGDVSRPGIYPVNNERVTVSEALSLAGDLNLTGMRNNVLLVREENGQRQYVRLDLQSKELFNSPYFYLKNNDMLYVQPSTAKFASINTSYRNIGIIISAISVLSLLLIRF